MDNHILRLDWQNPLNFAHKISENYSGDSWIFLYSALSDKIKNSTSYVALFPQQKIICDNFSAAEKILRTSDKKWFGYLSYETGNDFENLPKTEKSFISLPKIFLINFGILFEFNHDKRELTATFSDKKLLDRVLQWTPQQVRGDNERVQSSAWKVRSNNFSSNFTDESYLTTIRNIQKMIASGDLYQTNLTRKFFGEFTEKQNHQQAFQLFSDLTKISPANYSSFLKLDENFVISSSPELFLKARNGRILSRPIKGTAPRHFDPKQDRKNKSTLKNSAKERAENLMIVDLVRNDLSRICTPGSVKVTKLFNITSYQNIHHMSSEISGEISENFLALDAVKACFPAGSMTGAPKIKAMKVAAQLEKLDRGIYSGSIGFFSKNEINSSVVIRTLILQGQKFEFQVGGAITFDSDPEAELAEIFSKAKGIGELLGVDFG